jgi:3'(2'), 5'-bisphosphate nucleotidase
MPFEVELEAAIAAARLAGEYIRREYETFTPIPNAPASISTHVDKGSQELILAYLAERFPEDGRCAEESSAGSNVSGRSGRTWVVDPIDGTRGFVMKNGEFSVMIALIVGHFPVVGVVLEPVTGRMTYATDGGGCWVRTGDESPARCRVTTTAEPVGCTLIQSRPKPKNVPTPAVQAVQPGVVLQMYSAGLKLAAVARGDGDVYVNDYGVFHDWDICAGHILVTEAGGRVTGLRGEPIGYGWPPFKQRHGLLGSNGVIHDAALARLANL